MYHGNDVYETWPTQRERVGSVETPDLFFAVCEPKFIKHFLSNDVTQHGRRVVLVAVVRLLSLRAQHTVAVWTDIAVSDRQWWCVFVDWQKTLSSTRFPVWCRQYMEVRSYCRVSFTANLRLSSHGGLEVAKSPQVRIIYSRLFSL